MAIQNKPDVLNPMTLHNTPGQELLYIFESRGIKEAEKLLGEKFIEKKTVLSKPLLRKAGKLLEIGDALIPFFENFTKQYKINRDKSKKSFIEATKDYKKLKKISFLLKGQYTEGFDRLEDILNFFDVEDAQEIYEKSEKQAALYRTQNGVETDPINLFAWLRRGEIDFRDLHLGNYNEEALRNWVNNKEWLSQIENPRYFKKLPQIFSNFGVGLTLVPFLPKTVYGAVRWIDGKPLIEISDRKNDLISCWFTLFHEIGHVLLHKDQDIYEGNINDFNSNKNKIEKEANKFANKVLFNGDNLRKAVFERKRNGIWMSANSLGEEFGVKPIFASYWLVNAQYHPEFQRRVHVEFVDDYQ